MSISKAISIVTVLLNITPLDLQDLIQGFNQELITEESLNTFPPCGAEIDKFLPLFAIALEKCIAAIDGACANAATDALLTFYDLEDVCLAASPDVERVETWLSQVTTEQGRTQIESNIASQSH